jgi:hypothetical protein
MYAAVHVREEFGDYLRVALDEENGELDLHLTTDIYITVNQKEWETIVEKVAEATFGKW